MNTASIVDNGILSYPEHLRDDLRPLLQGWDYDLRARNRAKLTRASYLRGLGKFTRAYGKHPLTATKRDIQIYVSEALDTFASATVRHDYAAIQQFYAWAVREGELEAGRNPLLGVTPPRVTAPPKDIVELKQLVAVLAGLDKKKAYRDAALCSLLCDTGMRAGEAARITMQDLDMEESVIMLGVTKNGEPREVPFSPATGARIDRWLRNRVDKKAIHLFTGTRSHRGNPLTPSGVFQIVSRVFREAGIENIGPHDLRHTFATLYLDDPDARTEDLQAICGWNSQQMVERYTRLRKQRRARAGHARSSPLMRQPGKD